MFKRALVAISAAFALLSAQPASAEVSIDNGPSNGSTFECFFGDCNSYAGEIFTAPITGYITSFTIYTNTTLGDGITKGYISAGLQGWKAPDIGDFENDIGFDVPFSNDIYLSPTTNIDFLASGPQTFAPHVHVVAGHQYIAYLRGGSFTGDTALLTTDLSMPGFEGYALSGGGNAWTVKSVSAGPNLLFQATFLPAQVLEPSTWAVMVLGLGIVGSAMRWRGRVPAA